MQVQYTGERDLAMGIRVVYTGEHERTIGIQVVYPGEFLEASSNQLAAWRAEHGDVFAVVDAQAAMGESAGAVVVQGDAAQVFGDVAAADQAAAQAMKGRRK